MARWGVRKGRARSCVHGRRRPPHRIDPESKLLIIDWPSNGHDGGDLAFGNDGYLYVSSGDGSCDSDANDDRPDNRRLARGSASHRRRSPRSRKELWSAEGQPLRRPQGSRPELWAYGLRNPWRISFDRESGQLWVGQNGQDLWEQVYLFTKGGNYGWSLREGSHIFHALRKAGPDPISPPTAEHSHSEALADRRHRLSRHPIARAGGTLSTATGPPAESGGSSTTAPETLAQRARRYTLQITGFGTDHAGELYVIDQVTGSIASSPQRGRPPLCAIPDQVERVGTFSLGRRPQAAPGRDRL